MNPLPEINLCIVQPLGYVHSLGLLDQARYFRWQFRRLGARVSLAKNRLRHDAVNFVFGAHLGFDAEQTRRQTCIFVNLEQLGQGGAQVSADYLRLLAGSAVVDYDADNLAAYAKEPGDVPLVPFLFAPYLALAEPMPLEERPIDLLFFGSMNPRRRAFIDRVEALGRTVSVFDAPLYGPERDVYIARAKAVLNVHFYESSRFEQARVSHCLSLGTPVISERTAQTRPHAAFEDSVLWLQDDELEQFFGEDFGTPACYDALRAGLERFAQTDPVEAYADLLAFAAGFGGEHHKRREAGPWRPSRLNLGSGKDYQAGWLNIDVLDRAQPDLLLDLAQPLSLPLVTTSPTVGPLRLEAASLDLINANNVLEHVPDLPGLMSNCLQLLKTGGELRIEVPYERAATAWQDPTHVRAMNENSWIYYTEWFWYLGWFDHRFEMASSTWLDLQLQPCEQARAAFMRVVLRKVETTARERTTARTLQPDFGGVDGDWPQPVEPGADAIRLVPIELPEKACADHRSAGRVAA
jgi:SAM-dependent methyltransferase